MRGYVYRVLTGPLPAPPPDQIYLDTTALLSLCWPFTKQPEKWLQSFKKIITENATWGRVPVFYYSEWTLNEALYLIIDNEFRYEAAIRNIPEWGWKERLYNTPAGRQIFRSSCLPHLTTFLKELASWERLAPIVLPEQVRTSALQKALRLIINHELLPTDAFHVAVAQAAGIRYILTVDHVIAQYADQTGEIIVLSP